MHAPPNPLSKKNNNNQQNDSNFQAVPDVQIIRGKPITSLAIEMRKMALKPAPIGMCTCYT